MLGLIVFIISGYLITKGYFEMTDTVLSNIFFRK